MKIRGLFLVTLALLFAAELSGQPHGFGNGRTAKWIAPAGCQNEPNTWITYKKTVETDRLPEGDIYADIAVDSKYWLWINGRQVVFEGGLKRSPNPADTYFDRVDLTPHLVPGRNDIAVLVWYFGKEGYSHKTSGHAGLLFDCPGAGIVSDGSWRCTVLPEYGTAGDPQPNYRLPESSILYDARIATEGWWQPQFDIAGMPYAVEVGSAEDGPWGKLVERPIPQWKDYGLKDYPARQTVSGSVYDTVICTLPYNAQITPWFDIEADKGDHILIMTDNYLRYNGGETNLRGEYIARQGRQEYENPGWLNGHKVYYLFPKGVKVHGLGYRETGYDTEFEGMFRCSDPFFNALWEKSVRTLYITMRDSYMDCPDRERAQWTGDAVNESGEAFYVLSQSSYDLSRKWLYETIGGWQREDGSIYSPTPSGNYFSELPAQSLATVGYYGLWTYYLYTGDIRPVADLFDNVKRYLDLWEIDDRGLVKYREAGWNWGDWGDNRDMLLIYNLWYYLAVKGMYYGAVELGRTEDADNYLSYMTRFVEAFKACFWTGNEYRDPDYTGETDDRVHALAVVSGVAGEDKYPAILGVFQRQEHASPYMEKYVFEAMMRMGYASEAMDRHKKRFGKMVDFPLTTLFEGWGIGPEGFGGGTVNHAWSGGGLTVLSQYVCGVAPTEPGWEMMHVLPVPGYLTEAEISVPTVKGTVESKFTTDGDGFNLSVTIPEVRTCVIGVPADGAGSVFLNGELIWTGGKFVDNGSGANPREDITGHIAVEVGPGSYEMTRTGGVLF
ncbi:MAG: glycoside hydrolase [Rikenellaceae bacterium]|nr:glycoside hydrolase [Rikenellaceae bacterium]